MGKWMLTVRKLQFWWRGFNDAVFGGELRPIKIECGYIEPNVWGMCYDDGCICILDTLSEADGMSTLLHEMIHQWQYENGLPMNHGNTFSKWRKTCRLRTGLLV